jgi:hypothetical protein
MRCASNDVGLYDAVNTAFLIRSANVTERSEHLVSCFHKFNGDSCPLFKVDSLTRFEHQMGIFSLLTGPPPFSSLNLQ